MIIYCIMHARLQPTQRITCSESCLTVLFRVSHSRDVGVRLGKVALAGVCQRSAGVEPEAAVGRGVMGTGTNTNGKEAHGPAVSGAG